MLFSNKKQLWVWFVKAWIVFYCLVFDRVCDATTRRPVTSASSDPPASSLQRDTPQRAGMSVCGTCCYPQGVPVCIVSTEYLTMTPAHTEALGRFWRVIKFLTNLCFNLLYYNFFSRQAYSKFCQCRSVSFVSDFYHKGRQFIKLVQYKTAVCCGYMTLYSICLQLSSVMNMVVQPLCMPPITSSWSRGVGRGRSVYLTSVSDSSGTPSRPMMYQSDVWLWIQRRSTSSQALLKGISRYRRLGLDLKFYEIEIVTPLPP